MLYHVRLYKQPTETADGLTTGTFTLTNDLGELFFYGSATVTVRFARGGRETTTNVKWKAGMRSAKFSVRGTSTRHGDLIVSVNASTAADELYPESKPGFLGLRYSPEHGRDIVVRDLPEVGFSIREELGSHSLARHVWDAGLALCKYFVSGGRESFKGSILELGTGCGLVGLCLARIDPSVTVVLTDLDDAQELCLQNIQGVGNTRFQELDWEDSARCQDLAAQCNWDAILVADCTYNPDSYDMLLRTIDQLAGPNTKVVVAHKFRDSSESEFFTKFPYKLEIDETVDFYGQSVKLVVGVR